MQNALTGLLKPINAQNTLLKRGKPDNVTNRAIIPEIKDMVEISYQERLRNRVSTTVPIEEQSLYETSTAFGHFGIRSFQPTPMDAPHWHGHVEFNLIRNGRLIYDYDGQRIEISDDRPVLFWAGIPHHLTEVHSNPGHQISQINLYIPVDRFLFMPHISALQMALLGGGIAALPAGSISESNMLRWKEDYQSGLAEHREVMRMEINACLRRALLDGIEYLNAPETSSGKGAFTSPQHLKLVEMVRHILENLQHPLTISSVAEVVGLHPNYASSLFANTLHLPMKRFIIRMRLLRARAHLIEENTPISAVAEDSGFSSTSQFYDHFNAAYGMSPLQMRKQMLQALTVRSDPV